VNNTSVMTSIYSFKIDGIAGEQIDFADFKGKYILLVNVASQCGYTPQYAQLQELYTTFKDILIIIGCPANNFGKQEPGTNDEIKTFCSLNYGVTFPITTKISVKGDNIHPLYQWLTQKSKNGKMDTEVQWNFQKYLINTEGELTDMFVSAIDPCSEEIINAITR